MDSSAKITSSKPAWNGASTSTTPRVPDIPPVAARPKRVPMRHIIQPLHSRRQNERCGSNNRLSNLRQSDVSPTSTAPSTPKTTGRPKATRLERYLSLKKKLSVNDSKPKVVQPLLVRPKEPAPFPFLALPGELRNMTYKYALPCDGVVDISVDYNSDKNHYTTKIRDKTCTTLLLVNRQVRTEAFGFIISRNTIRVPNATFPLNFDYFIERLGPKYIPALTRLIIPAPWWTINNSAWHSVFLHADRLLDQLKRLQLKHLTVEENFAAFAHNKGLSPRKFAQRYGVWEFAAIYGLKSFNFAPKEPGKYDSWLRKVQDLIEHPILHRPSWGTVRDIGGYINRPD